MYCLKYRTETETEIESKRGRQIEGAIDREGERERDRGGDKWRGRQIERQTDREGER